MLTIEDLEQAACRAGFQMRPCGVMRKSFSRKGGSQHTRVQVLMHQHRERISARFQFLNNIAYSGTLSVERTCWLKPTDDISLFEAFLEQLDGI